MYVRCSVAVFLVSIAAGYFYNKYQVIAIAAYNFDAKIILICHHVSFQFAFLPNDGNLIRTNCTYQQVFKKNKFFLDELVFLLIMLLNLCVIIL